MQDSNEQAGNQEFPPQKSMRELTAKEDRCGDRLTCPSVFENNGKLIIVGKKVDIDALAARIGDGEAAIEIDAGILERALASGAPEGERSTSALSDGGTGHGEAAQ